jgi:hypothetical protein
VNFGGRPPQYFGYREPNPSALKLWITSRTRSSLVNATFAIWATSMPWAGSSTICARRQVTTDPLSLRTTRTSRRPSSSSISRTRTRPATGPVWTTAAHPGQRPALGIRVLAVGRVSLLSAIGCKGYRAPLQGSSETVFVVADTSETEECNG